MTTSSQSSIGAARLEPTAELRRTYVLRVAAASFGLVGSLLLSAVVLRVFDGRSASTYLAIMAGLMIGPMLGRCGTGTTAIRDLAEVGSREQSAQIISSRLRATLIASLLTAPFVAFACTVPLSGHHGQMQALALTAVLVTLETIRLTVSDIFAALGDYWWSVLTTHYARSVAVAVMVLGLWFVGFGKTLLWLLVIYVAVAAALLGMALVRLSASFGTAVFGNPHQISASLALRSGFPILVVELCAFVVGRADVWVSAWAFQPDAAAGYGGASVLAFQVAVPLGLASVSLAPTVARMWKRDEIRQLRRLLDSVATLATIFSALLVATLWVFGSEITRLLYGRDSASAGTVAAILATGLLAPAASGLSSVLLLLTGHAREMCYSSAVVIVVAIPALLIAGFASGPIGLAITSSLCTVALVGCQAFIARRRLGFAPWPRSGVLPALHSLRFG